MSSGARQVKRQFQKRKVVSLCYLFHVVIPFLFWDFPSRRIATLNKWYEYFSKIWKYWRLFNTKKTWPVKKVVFCKNNSLPNSGYPLWPNVWKSQIRLKVNSVSVKNIKSKISANCQPQEKLARNFWRSQVEKVWRWHLNGFHSIQTCFLI